MNHLKRKRYMLAGVLTVAFAAVLFLALYLKHVADYQKAVKDLTYQRIEVTSLPDGTYTGECDVDYISAKVSVEVKRGGIEKVTLIEHKNDRGAAAEPITEEIVRRQKIDVDTVSGATNSSKVIKKAVEQALLSAK